MGPFAEAQVVLLDFPFSDLSRSKGRPGLLLAAAGRGDWIVCQITSNPYIDTDVIRLADEQFISGSLSRISFIRPKKLFTAHESRFLNRLGVVDANVLRNARELLIMALRNAARS